MLVPGWVKSLFIVNDSILDNQFTLAEPRGESADSSGIETDASETRSGETRGATRDETPGHTPDETHQGGYGPVDEYPVDEYPYVIPTTSTLRGWPFTGIRRLPREHAGDRARSRRTVRPDRPEQAMPLDLDRPLPADLEHIKEELNRIFHLPDNKDVYIREFRIGTNNPWPAFAVFVDGMSDKMVINSHILEPLMYLTHLVDCDIARRIDVVSETLLPGNQSVKADKWKEVVQGILAGSTAVFVEGCPSALLVETKGWEHRTVSQAQTEVVVRGPHDAFTENFRANTGLVRSKLRSQDLVTEMLSVGKLGKTDVAVMYIKGVANEKLIREVKRRIKDIDVDYLADSGEMEQFLEDDPTALVPQVMSTERPDRIAYMLTEGHVAIFVGNSPFILAVPVVLWTLVHTPEDAYLRFPYGSFLRILRWISMGVGLLLPALYIAVTNYQPEMLPTDLMLAIAGSREQVPFPVVGEVLLMEFAIELIREAGIRIPSVIGPTIGIVGALIIGQAAVQAGIVSPLLVIVVAVTALAAFTIPNYNLSLGIRVARFAFLIAAALFGFYGIALLLTVFLAKLAVQKSFGVPFLAPVAPSMDASQDVLLRGPSYTMNERPTHLQSQKSWRQQPVTRPWSKQTRPLWKRGRRGKS